MNHTASGGRGAARHAKAACKRFAALLLTNKNTASRAETNELGQCFLVRGESHTWKQRCTLLTQLFMFSYKFVGAPFGV